MSFDILKTVDFPQAACQYVPQEILGGNAIEDFPILGGLLSDLKHLWHAKGPCLEVRQTTSGRKVGSWTFGGILKDSNTKIVAVDELKRTHGRLPLLVVALECTISGGLVSVFDIFSSKVLRVVQVKEQITSVHVIDSGCENSVLPEPSPLRYFDGTVAVGTLGGNVYLLDMCKQSCENGIHNVDSTIRDELSPCPMIILNKEKVNNIKKYVERSVDREEHLAIHINVIVNPLTEHFTLKGENGEDRVHVNRSEAEVSSLFYSSQIASLLVGYNFGAFQLWDLRSLELAYTSPICEEHIPVMHFTVQEPADDPKAYCYIWVSYSHNLMFHSGLPFAVMYSFYYDTKNYVNGYGNLYEDFQHCSVRFQIELGDTETPNYSRGGACIGLQSLNRYPINKDLHSLSLCLISWLVWNSHKEVNTCVLIFDLNQWYKEQMPRSPNWSHCSNYIIKNSLSNQALDVKLDQRSLNQFIGVQRLEEHFCPTALSFDLWCVTEDSVLKVHNKGLQKAFLHKIVNDQHLSLVRPEDYFEQITSLGLVPLFCDVHLSNSLDIDYHREILLNVALEQKLIGWLCNSTSKLANNAFNASGLTIHSILRWAFERAITLKNACDKYCISLFDYSGTRLDNNTILLINSSTCQIRNICSLYRYVAGKLMHFISDKITLLEEQRSLENVVVYFEVLLWMVNIGLLPECQLKNRQGHDDITSAPYLVQDLTRYYNKKRAQLQTVSHDTFVEKDCLLFIDNLINIRGGAEILRQQWQEDGGSGLYPPPSLQSVLRTYFLDGPDLVSKHCLVTYTLLDIAMTVDENNKVIKLLLKFPQIFDLSQSNIKIVQAFWHLDHDDYETAMDYILDPCVLTEDLHHWHHSVMMRSLLLQDQSSLALLYLQIRKPSIQNEKDLLTVISLLISKNMVDEAFKFRQQHQNPNEQALLLHIFNECNKNALLHSLLYRRLNDDEEQAFFKYLQNTRNPRCEDLKIFYYLLRSRFLEAFDSYSATKRKKPENQGLIGQRDATTADNIVKMFKTLLPDVSKNLVDLVRKERTNLWKEVKKPTPLSVFVHNTQDQVKYKSSIIFAVLAKAKQTFNDTLNDTRLHDDVVTEETPFLRTPTAFRSVSSVATPLMKSKVIEQNEQGEEYGPSPCKKLKLSPYTSKTCPVKSKSLSQSTVQSKISTPIIRRLRLSTESQSTTISMLPQSILKASSASRTILDDSILDENTSANTSLALECENSVRRSRLALTPRKPVSRTPSHVKFDDLRYSNSSNEQSKNESTLHHLIPETSRSQSVSSNASTVDDIYYSPDNSPGDHSDDGQKTAAETADQKKQKKSLSPIREKLSFDETVGEDDAFMEDQQAKDENKAVRVAIEDNDLSTNRLTFQSPRSRRSYKRSFGENAVPVRSSPRLARKASREDKEELESMINKSDPLVQQSPATAMPKLKGRKSLSRAVLENNTFSKQISSSVFDGNTSEASSSFNTTINDSESEMETEQSDNDSIQELLAKYRAAMEGVSSFNSSHSSPSLAENYIDILEKGEVISKTTEVRSLETHSESVIKRDTCELVSFKESRDEYNLKKVEMLEQDELQEKKGSKNSLEISIFDETTQEFKGNVRGTVDDHKKSEAVGRDVSESHKTFDEEKSDETRQHDEINVYEDLSSGSEDLREVLKQFKKNDDTEKIYADISFSTSVSYYQSEKKDELMPKNLMESGESNSNASKSSQPLYDNNIDMEELYDDIPVTERAFIDSADVIEIVSSDDDTGKQNQNKPETDESSQSNSSSEKELHAFKGESNDHYDMNVGFERNLNETARRTASSDDRQSSDDDKSRSEGDAQEEQASGPVQDKKFKEDMKVKRVSKNVKQKLKEMENKMYDFVEESSESSLKYDASPDIERQLELDQKEIAAAVKTLQTDSEHRIESGDDEQMDCLILEPNIVEFDERNEGLNIDEQKATECDRECQENAIIKQCSLGVNDFLIEPLKSENETKTFHRREQENPVTSLKISRSLQCTLGVNDTIMEFRPEDNTSVAKSKDESMVQSTSENKSPHMDVDKKEASISPLKQCKSLQCTLGVNDFIMESYAEDNTSVVQRKDECIVLITDQETSETKARQIGMGKNEPSIALLKQSKSLQCTLGVDDSVMESYTEANISVIQGKCEGMVFNTDQISLKNNTEHIDIDEKEASVSPRKQSKSLQCTLGVNDSEMASVEDFTSVFLDNNKTTASNENLGTSKNTDVAPKNEASRSEKKISSSLQCSVDGISEAIMEISKEDNISVSCIQESKENEDATSLLVLRTVKKTYPSRKHGEVSETTDEGTPKLVVCLPRQTYAKKNLSGNNKPVDSNVPSSHADIEEASQSKQSSEMNIEKTHTPKDEIKVHTDLQEQNKVLEGVESKENDCVIKETLDSVEHTPPKGQDSVKPSGPISSDDNITVRTEVTQDSFKPKSEDAANQPSFRMTRRRSMLLSQDGTLSSTSEKSIRSSSGDSIKLQEEKDRSSETPSESGARRPSRLSESLFDSTLLPESPIRHAEVDVMENLDLGGNVNVILERDVFETDEEMRGKESSEDKAGVAKVLSRSSLKKNTETEPSTAHESVSHAISLVKVKKRTRSASVDQPTMSIQKRSIRSKSIDFDDMKGPTTENKLLLVLNPIPEQAGPSTFKDVPQEVSRHNTKAYSDVGAYTTSRRLTRRQASMLKTIGKIDDETKKLPSLEEFDPVHLLDKSEFAGKPDPDESKVYEQSSPSNSSGTLSRHIRSASVVSDVSGTPTKKTTQIKNRGNSPASGIKSRLRKPSNDTMSVTSEQSDSPSPSKKAKKTEDGSEVQSDSQSVKKGKRGRSRASSVSSTKSAASEKSESFVRATRSRKTPAISELPEIREEKGGDEGDMVTTSMIKKRGRKKKD